MKRQCQTCGTSIEEKRKNAKFCSSACRAEFWRNEEENNIYYPASNARVNLPDKSQEQIININNTQLSYLKGVLDDSNTNSLGISSNQTENPYYQKLKIELDRLGNKLIVVRRVLLNLEENKLHQEREIELLFPVLGTTVGMAVDLPKLSDSKEVNPWLRGLSIATGLIGGVILKNRHKVQRLEVLETIQSNIIKNRKNLSLLKEKITRLKIKLLNVPRFLTSKEAVSFFNIANNSEIEEIKTPLLNEKVICSNDLKKMNFKSLDFKNKWYNLFGKPAISFHLVVHGKPGQGKSTFCLQFASYLASNFGKVLYISGEEGFSKTMKDKFKHNNAYNKNLFLADIRSYDKIKEIIEPNTYHFIFIDSLNNMGIDIDQLKEMRELYKNSTLVTISQSTKKGQLRGSLEIEHESDVSLKIENGLAFTTKNRFKELGYEYAIFED